MLAVITHPHGVVAGAQSAEAQLQLQASSDQTDCIIATTNRWSAESRLEIYWNAYYARLQECLREEFPVLRGAVGDELFDEFVLEYLQAHPPSSYTLSQLGLRFPGFLAGTRPPRDAAAEGPDWADFLADLAHFEWTISAVFDGPGSEMMSSAPLVPSDYPLDKLDELTFECALSLRLCSYSFPVNAYHAAVKSGELMEVPSPRPTFVAFNRQNFTVQHHALNAMEFALLKSLHEGDALGDAIDALCERDDAAEAEVVTNIARWFADWTRAGFITNIAVATA